MVSSTVSILPLQQELVSNTIRKYENQVQRRAMGILCKILKIKQVRASTTDSLFVDCSYCNIKLYLRLL